jgi:hypothetical protein
VNNYGKVCGFFGKDPLADVINQNFESGGLNQIFYPQIAKKIEKYRA